MSVALISLRDQEELAPYIDRIGKFVDNLKSLTEG